MAGLLRSVAPDSSFIQLHDMKPFPKKATIPYPDPPLEVAKKLAYPSTSEELEHAMRLTKEQCSAVEAATRQQADSNEWVAQRQGRITASNFKRATTRSITLQTKPGDSAESVVKLVMGYNPVVNTKQTKHGRNLEPRAKMEYTKIQKKKHRSFAASDGGFII